MRDTILPCALGLALLAGPAWSQSLPDKPIVTIAEGSSCMGDDKSRKQTEEAARAESRRRAAEQALSLVRSETVIRDFALEKDLIAAYTQAKVRLLDELDSRWDKDCYFYRIRAEVSPEPKAMEKIIAAKASGGVESDESIAWAATQENQRLAQLDDFIARYPLSAHLGEAKALRDALVAEYPRGGGNYIAAAKTALHFKPRHKSARIGQIEEGESVEVVKAHDNDWAEVKLDYGVAYVLFADLRPVGKDELETWKRARDSQNVRQLQDFIAAYPLSHLAPHARAGIEAIQDRGSSKNDLSQKDKEEIAFWNLAGKSRDVRDVREYRRRWPNGKFEKESLALLIELTSKTK